jgi:hypothetical protein
LGKTNHVGGIMQPKVLILAAAGLFAATAAQACPACGDKLSLVGGGVSFERVSQAGPPGRIVVLAEPGSAVQAAESDLGLVAEFKRAGHNVKVVADANELDRVVRDQGADVVIAHWSEAAATAGRLGRSSDSPTVVPVAYKSDDAAAAMAAGAGKCVCQADQRKGRKLAETVDKVLVKRSKGEPAECPVVVASRTS